MKQRKVKINWDTVELVGDLVPAPVAQHSEPAQTTTRPVLLPFPQIVATIAKGSDPRIKLILSGASAKARARGPSHTHTQLRKIIPAGIETLIYGWWLMTAAMESGRDLSSGVEIAAHAIGATSQHFMRLQ